VLYALAGGDPLQDHILLVLSIGRNQASDRLADHLVRGIAEQSLCRCVPARDDALERLGDDCIRRRVDDRGKQRLLGFGFHALAAPLKVVPHGGLFFTQNNIDWQRICRTG
jgi:hypothetical protein